MGVRTYDLHDVARRKRRAGRTVSPAKRSRAIPQIPRSRSSPPYPPTNFNMSNNPLLSTLIHRYPSKDVEEATWSDSEDTSRSSTPPLSDVPSGKDIPGLPGDTGASMAAAEVRTTRQGNEWRDPSTIHSRSFWQVRAKGILLFFRRRALTLLGVGSELGAKRSSPRR